jgi:hypothetical protein
VLIPPGDRDDEPEVGLDEALPRPGGRRDRGFELLAVCRVAGVAGGETLLGGAPAGDRRAELDLVGRGQQGEGA